MQTQSFTFSSDCNNPKPKRPIVVNKKLQKCGQSCYCSDETGKMYHNMTEKAKTPYDDIMLEWVKREILVCLIFLNQGGKVKPQKF